MPSHSVRLIVIPIPPGVNLVHLQTFVGVIVCVCVGVSVGVVVFVGVVVGVAVGVGDGVPEGTFKSQLDKQERVDAWESAHRKTIGWLFEKEIIKIG